MKQVYSLVVILLVTGCELVDSKQQVVYEDNTPVVDTLVHQWSDDIEYYVYTDEEGTWTLKLPLGSSWELCIQNPRDNYEESCYNGILTVDINGSLK